MARLHIRDDVDCNTGGGADTFFAMRVASIFIILVGSVFGALFPVLAKRTKWLNVPKSLFDFAKYFGSGVIIATAFIHLLDPAIGELTSPCLSPSWQTYPYAVALAMFSIFAIFIVELVAFRWGTARLAKLGISYDAHGHGIGAMAAHGPESTPMTPLPGAQNDIESAPRSQMDTDSQLHKHYHGHGHSHDDAESGALDSPLAQVIGIAILEFGVLLHSVLIGLTLAVDPDFKVLFVVLIFHQTFEGLGVGSRLAFMKLPPEYNRIPIYAALVYGVATPIGIAAGLGVRTTYNPNTPTASIVSGVMDSLSAGILIYTGLVELLAHEFLFNKEMIEGSNSKLFYALSCMLLGCGIMALLGRWA